MNWAPMLSWPWWLAMASVPPLIIMLYFLKLRRQPVEVPSTYLWRRTLEDLHVNSIWQRLRRNILLFLQLLVIAILVLALLRPGMRGSDTVGDRVILMIDNSASMQAVDVAANRVAEAKQRALHIIDALDTNDAAMVIAFSDAADVRQTFTTDKRRLRAAVDSIAPTYRTTDLTEALRAASGLANPGRTSQIEDLNDIQVAEALPANVFILSDGGFAPPQLDLGNLKTTYLPIGQPTAQNVGIVGFTVDRNAEREDQVEAFARVQNFGSQVVDTNLNLYLDDQLIDARAVTIEPQSVSGVSFDIHNLESGVLKLVVDHQDDLSVDNIAFAGLDPPKVLDVVLVTAGNVALEAALKTSQVTSIANVRLATPEELDSPQFQSLLRSGTIDLFVFDDCRPAVPPEASALYINAVPPESPWKMTAASGPLFVIDSNRSHPLMQYVDLGTVRIVEGSSLELPPGGTELARTDAGVLIGIAPRDAYLDAVVAMPLNRKSDQGTLPNTDWPIKRSFPVFFFNALQTLGGAVATSASKSVLPGRPVPLSVTTRVATVHVETPAGEVVQLERGNTPQLVFTDTERPGIYRVRGADNDRILQLFTVNLFSERESDIVPVPDLQIGVEKVTGTANQEELVRVEYWRWLLLLALVVLGIEWYVYNRRIAV